MSEGHSDRLDLLGRMSEWFANPISQIRFHLLQMAAKRARLAEYERLEAEAEAAKASAKKAEAEAKARAQARELARRHTTGPAVAYGTQRAGVPASWLPARQTARQIGLQPWQPAALSARLAGSGGSAPGNRPTSQDRWSGGAGPSTSAVSESNEGIVNFSVWQFNQAIH